MDPGCRITSRAAAALLAAWLLLPMVAFGQNNERLWYTAPATDWRREALHLGNGHLGASFYGGVREERFDTTEKTLWRGGPGENADYRYGIKPGGREYLPAIRQAITRGDAATADRLVRQHFLGDYRGFGAFSSLGSLRLNFDSHDGAVSAYRRELDLSRSLARVSYTIDSTTYQREYFCSYPDRVLVVRVSCGTPGRLGFTLSHDLIQHDRSIRVEDGDLVIAGTIDGNSREYRVRVRVEHEGGTLSAAGDTLRLAGADRATVYYAAATEYRPEPPLYRGADPDRLTRSSIEAAAALGYDALQRRHIEDYRRLYDRVHLQLAGDPALEALSTDRRWQRWYDGDRRDVGLKVLLFNLGRYLLISASRPGAPPSNLQGVWNTYPTAPWQANYQSNINLQEMYWSCGPVNLPECERPYLDWIRGLVVPGREVAQAYYGTGGWVSHTTGNVWGYAAPGTGLLWGVYPAGAAWHCQQLWEHYAFTMDQAYLRREAYPAMKEAAEFWLENLVAYEGCLISAPTVSAEHGAEEKDERYVDPSVNAERPPRGGAARRYNIPGAYQDIEMIYDLFTNVMAAADVLQTDREFRARVAGARARLLPLRIGKHGQLQEWALDIDSPTDHHRHISHLWAVHPGRMIDPIRTPKLADAARKSLDMRGDGRFPGWPYSGGNWARAWRIWCWARLDCGERADRIFSEMIAEQGVPNLMTFQHVPGQDNMQVDASMSTPGFMAEMLVQSHQGELRLLPALPPAWRAGKVDGLLARGGHMVALEWKDGQLVHATITMAGGQRPAVRVQGERVEPDEDARIEWVKR